MGPGHYMERVMAINAKVQLYELLLLYQLNVD